MTFDPFDPFNEVPVTDFESKVAQLAAEVADLKQTSEELCEVCGWRFVVLDRCLNCEKG
jgi:hypothetical protein